MLPEKEVDPDLHDAYAYLLGYARGLDGPRYSMNGMSEGWKKGFEDGYGDREHMNPVEAEEAEVRARAEMQIILEKMRHTNNG